MTGPQSGVLVDNVVPSVLVRGVETREGVRLGVEDSCDVKTRYLKWDRGREECECQKETGELTNDGAMGAGCVSHPRES